MTPKIESGITRNIAAAVVSDVMGGFNVESSGTATTSTTTTESTETETESSDSAGSK